MAPESWRSGNKKWIPSFTWKELNTAVSQTQDTEREKKKKEEKSINKKKKKSITYEKDAMQHDV